MLSTGELWNPSDLQQIDVPPEIREKELKKDLRQPVQKDRSDNLKGFGMVLLGRLYNSVNNGATP
ncbi:hypothetical protein DCCM_2352 [Desulfocucumis palustris]|uniref:Uncharacterized protein n=1 Tax=Desulfocucumis palustris TaxID=1898651 RepID=A0A2L2XC33_9FIRM|nr:hypothetical protein DCCM_2352 [Desulfocucumis palustris]